MAESMDRNETARQAAETLFPGGRTRRPPNLHNYGTVAQNTSEFSVRRRLSGVCCGFISDVRRTFCLLVTFDLILMFVLWGVFVQLKTSDSKNNATGSNESEKQFYKKFADEVVNYTFNTSLFDAVVCGMLRFAFLITAYGLFRLQNPSIIALTTFVTSLFVIVKVFLFEKFNNNPPSYLLLITSFLIAWVETWLLDFRVLPFEKSNLHSQSHEGAAAEDGGSVSERDPLLRNKAARENDSNFCTPEEGSDVEEDEDRSRSPNALLKSDHRRRAEAAWNQAWKMLNLQNGWIRESSVSDIITHSQTFNSLGKVFRIEADIDTSATDVFHITSLQFSDIPKWNPTVLECKILRSLGPSTDVTYVVTATAGKGMVSSRDFVSARHWKTTEAGDILVAGCAVTDPMMPEKKQHVRGEDRISGWLFQSVPNNKNRCSLKVLVCTDIKGWIPQWVVDQAVTGVLIETIQNLQQYVAKSTVVNL